MPKTKILILTLILLAFLQAGLLVYLFFEISKSPDKNFLSGVFFGGEMNRSRSSEDKNFSDNGNKALGGILPHHLIVREEIESYLSRLAGKDYDEIILICPNHFSRGKYKIAFPKTTDREDDEGLGLVKEVLKTGLAGEDDEVIANEPSVTALTPIIREHFPQAKIIPVILKPNVTAGESEILAEKIFQYTERGNTLVLASADFSHYQSFATAELHDEKSRKVIENFTMNEIYRLEIDSPASVYTILKFAQLREAEKAELVFHTNSGELAGNIDAPSTSHLFYYFYRGKKEPDPGATFLFFGDLMLDRHVGEKIKKDGLESLFSELAGEEQRFFQGMDIISANLEGAVTDKGAHYSPANAYDFAFSPELIGGLKKYNFNFFNLANNHFSDQGQRGIIETGKNLQTMGFSFSGCQDAEAGECSATIVEKNGLKIGMAGFSMVYKKFDLAEAEKIVSELKKQSDLAVVNIHWGTEYEHAAGAVQKETGRTLVDAGADMIIGHHPHVVQGMEIYKNKPIFYSLGNFVFDQYFSPDTQEGLAAGIAYNKNKIRIFLIPLKSSGSRPGLMSGSAKDEFFVKFIDWSSLDEKVKEQISANGIIELKQ
ncbi:MAG: AmmeMemoRadiSam system protein B [Patescibacteria group bacterium]